MIFFFSIGANKMTNSIFGYYLFAYLLSSIECFCVLTAWNQNNTMISVLLTAFN